MNLGNEMWRRTFLFSSLVWTCFALATSVRAVTFPDANLEAVVREALNQPSGEITTAQMLSLTNLHAGDRNIGDTTGLEAAHHLEWLVLNGNPVTNCAGFAGLKNLTRLDFTGAGLSDLSFISGLTNLESLFAYENQITDLSPLASLTRLRLLQLDWNPVTNHTPLSVLTNLNNLSLAGNGISNLTFIVPLQRLESLSLYVNQVHDISLLAGRTNLQSLSLGWNGVTNPSVLATLTGLRELWVNGNSFTNVPFLVGLTNLVGLSLDYTALTDMSPVTNLTGLSWLNVGENELTELPDLSPLAGLSTFMMAGNKISDLWPLTNLPALGELHLQRNAFHSVLPLTNLTQLHFVLLGGNPLDDVSEVGALTQIDSLELRSMHLTNLDFLLPLENLRYLDIGENDLREITTLTNFELGFLNLEANRLTEIAPLADCPWLWYVNLRFNFLDTNAASQTMQIIAQLQANYTIVEFDPQNPVPVLPFIVTQPMNRSAFAGSEVIFAVAAGGGTPELHYRWQKDGVDLSDGAEFSGAETEVLEIDNVTAADAGQYRVRIWDDWLTTNSVAVQLIVVTNVVFTDPNLEQSVRDRIGIPTGPIAPADLVGIDYLDAAGRNITNLSGLELLADLMSVNLSDNWRIEDFGALTYLHELRGLTLVNCGMDDLDRIPFLPQVTELNVSANFINDLSPLTRWFELEYLWLNENQITHLTPLLSLLNLSEVHVPWNRVDTNSAPEWAAINELISRGVFVEFDPQLAPPEPPVITQQPVNVTAYPGDNISFNVSANGSGSGLNFRWLKNGVNLEDDLRVHNAAGDVLFIDAVEPGDGGLYRVRIWDDHGVTNSRTVNLSVITGIAFTDPQLERAVRDHLGIPSAPLAPADMASLFWLEARRYGITNLNGIESAANLNWLLINGDSGITDFTPLTRLPALHFLELSECGVTSIDFVGSCFALNELNLWGNAVTDLAPLLDQTQITRLNLGYNPGITNISILDSLTGIEALWLDWDGISNVNCIAFMPNLRELNIYGNAVADIDALGGASKLVSADLGGNQITNAAALGNCTNLEWLSLAEDRVGDISFVTNLPHLWSLHLQMNPLADVSVLTGKTNFTQLNLSATAVTNFAPVSTLTRMTDIWLWQLGLSNVDFLAPLTNLTTLHASGNALTNLPPFPQFNRLRYLNLEWNPLGGISFVSGMTNLYELYLTGTGIHDLSPLTGKTNLHNLSLANNHVSELMPLATLSFLSWLTLYDNNLQNISALNGLTNLSYLDLRENLLDVFAPTPALDVIQTLQNRGVMVDYLPQNSGAIFLVEPERVSLNQFRFSIHSAPESVLEIWRSTNLTSWSVAGCVTNFSGSVLFTNAAPSADRAFFRAERKNVFPAEEALVRKPNLAETLRCAVRAVPRRNP